MTEKRFSGNTLFVRRIAMKAVIMAGGEGSRLRPLTCTLPKPMARLCGRPVLTYILDILIEAGFTEAVLTLQYMPNVITSYFPDDEYRGMSLEYVIEDEPLGTAGSVKNAVGGTGESVLVISGDALCDYSLCEAIAHHKQNGNDVTILCAEVSDPREYGLLKLSDDLRVTGFLEKPAWGQVTSDVANTGIYILEPSCLAEIPDGMKYDFAFDLFPKLLSSGRRLGAYIPQGYWCDIGDLESYRRCQYDMLSGKVKLNIPSVAEGVFSRGTLPRGDYIITPPVYIGCDVQIECGAVIGPGTVIDDGCLVGRGASVRESAVLENAYISAGCTVNCAVIASGASLKRGARVFEGGALGSESVLGENSVIAAGVLVWPKKEVENGTVCRENVKYQKPSKFFLSENTFRGDFGVELTPEKAAQLGCAVASLGESVRVGVGTDGQVNSEALRYGLLGGLVSCGARVWDFSECFYSQMFFYTAFCGLRTGIYINGGENGVSVSITGRGGLSVTRAEQRELENRLSRSEFRRSGSESCKSVSDMKSMNMMYMRELCAQAEKGLSGTEVSYVCSNTLIGDVLLSTFKRLGCKCDSDSLVVWVNDSGTRLKIFEDGFSYPFEKLVALAAYTELKSGNDVAVPWDTPETVAVLASSLGRRALRYADSATAQSDADAREIGIRQLWTRDALFLAVKILSVMHSEKKSLRELMADIPEFYISKRVIDIDVSPARLTKLLSKSEYTSAGEGVFRKTDGGTVRIKAENSGKALRIIAESASLEASEELCSDAEGFVESLLLDISSQ